VMQDAPEQPRSAAAQNVCPKNMLRAAGKDLPGPRHPPHPTKFREPTDGGVTSTEFGALRIDRRDVLRLAAWPSALVGRVPGPCEFE